MTLALQTDLLPPGAPPGSLQRMVRRRFMAIDWNKTFGEAHLHSWPTASLSVQNTKPPHETSRNIFKEDEREIMAAALHHGYRIVSPPKAKVVSFVKSSNVAMSDCADKTAGT